MNEMTSSVRRMVGALLMALMLMTSSSLATAQPEGIDEEAGKELAVEAMTHYKQANYAAALEKFEEAERVYPTGQVLRMKGYSLLALQRWLEAARTLDEALSVTYKPLGPGDAEHTNEQRAKALAHIATAKISSSIDGATARVDGGDPLELPATVRLEPGKHSFVVSAEGHDDAEEERPIGEGQTARIELDPTPMGGEEPPPTSEPTKPAPEPKEPEGADGGSSFGWFPGQGPVGLALAGLGLVAGGVAIGTGVYGTTLKSSVQENIDAHNANYDPNCLRFRDLCMNDIALINRDGKRAADHQNAAIATGIAGGAALLVGVTLFLLSDDSPLAPSEGNGGDELSVSCLPSIGVTRESHHGLGCSIGF